LKELIVSIFIAASFYFFGQREVILGQEAERVFRTQDSTQNFYLVLVPKTSIKGLLVILPGFGGDPRDVLQETDLPAKARVSGYLVVIPYLALMTNCSDSISQSRLAELVPEVIKKYKIPINKFIIGGHSIGGNGALLYAANAFRRNHEKIVKPNLVFGVDPPLDMKHLWETFMYFRKVNFSAIAVNEADYFLKRFESELGGTPLEQPNAYEKMSSFFRDAQDGGNTKFLKFLPVRLYSDPDVNWYIENRRTPIEHTNLADMTACIVQLRLLGNNEAELITNIGKGYFPDGRRHPHAFSQLDSDEFLRWVDKNFNKTTSTPK
jgi:pimeloyl-ACP methyl ester carboxylesterase